MAETFKLNESGGGATASLLFRLFRMLFILNLIAFPLFYLKLGLDKFYMAEIAIVALSLLIYLPKREAEKVHFENGKITVRGKKFLFVPFKTTVDYTRIKYRFNKQSLQKKKGVFKRSSLLTLYRNNKKWVTLSGSSIGWSKSKLGDIVKTLIAKGCYNWFEFNKKSSRKKKSS
jgi:hypothetical protein